MKSKLLFSRDEEPVKRLSQFGERLEVARFGWGQAKRLERFFTTVVDVADHDEAFYWIQNWLSVQPFAKKSRLLTVTTVKSLRYGHPVRWREPDDNDDTISGFSFAPAPGVHVFRYQGVPVILTRSRNESQRGNDRSYRDSFTLRFYTRNRKVIEALFDEARDGSVSPDQEVPLYMPNYDGWYVTTRRRPRPLDSVVLRDGLAEWVRDDVKRFIDAREWYYSRGVPYRRGYLLHGPAGCGKTSLVFALRSELKWGIAALNLGSSMDDEQLRKLLTQIPAKTFVLIEDIDSRFSGREATKEGEQSVTFSGLLNAIDGVASAEGRILFMTTNHKETLDEALIRAGRVDEQVYIGNATRSQVARLYRRFYADADERQIAKFVEELGDEIPMASVQNALMNEKRKQNGGRAGNVVEGDFHSHRAAG